MGAPLNWKLVGLVVLLAGASVAIATLGAGKEATDKHRQGRQFTLFQTLSRFSDPVIVLGDSIVEVSTLPRSICGRAIVNAGLNGASTASDLGGWLGAALAGRRTAAIVVALGVNDAMASPPPDKAEFAARYGALLGQLSKMTPRLAVLEIAPVEKQGNMTAGLRDEVVQKVGIYNDVLRDIAARYGATFVALPAMPTPHTVDGLHLNADGYLIWDQAVMQAAGGVCG